MAQQQALRHAVAISCFVLSGSAGLVYEVCWIRQSSLVFGSTTYALSTVLAVFFLGLAIGSETFGRVAARTARPLAIYAILEVGIAILALATLPAFGIVSEAYGSAYRAFGDSGAALLAARVALVALVILPPTILMGGTLPLFCRQYVRNESGMTSSIALLYALNTLGAAAGCVLAGFVLIPLIGVRAAVVTAAVTNVAAGAIVAFLKLRREPVAASAPAAVHATLAPDARSGASERSARLALGAVIFLSGFAVLGHEVLWTRFLRLLVRHSVFTYTITLAVILIGIVLGSALAGRLSVRAEQRAWWLGMLQALLGIGVLALLTAPPALWHGLHSSLVISFVLLLPPAMLSGASFPIAVRLAAPDPDRAGAAVGRVTAINTIGGILGSLFVGFWALPHLGIEMSLYMTCAASLAAAFGAWLFVDRARPIARRLVAPALAAAAFALALVISPAELPQDFLAWRRDRLVDWREGVEANLSIIERSSDELVLEIDRLWQGSDRKSHQIVAAHLPMLMHPNPKRVLVVGVGAGQTASRFLMYGITALDCVDIEPAIFDLVRKHYESAWMDDPRVRLIAEDGRNFVTHGRGEYDVISLELGQTFRPGVAAFYTEDLYRLTAARLAPGGIVSQFVPSSFLAPEMLARVIATFVEVFPQSTLWYNTTELLLVGTNADRFEIDVARVESRLGAAEIHADLDYRHGRSDARDDEGTLNRPEAFLASLLAGPAELAAMTAGAAPLDDDRPTLEYVASRLRPSDSWERENVELLRRHLVDLQTLLADPLPIERRAAISRLRERNLSEMIEFGAQRTRDVW